MASHQALGVQQRGLSNGTAHESLDVNPLGALQEQRSRLGRSIRGNAGRLWRFYRSSCVRQRGLCVYRFDPLFASLDAWAQRRRLLIIALCYLFAFLGTKILLTLLSGSLVSPYLASDH